MLGVIVNFTAGDDINEACKQVIKFSKKINERVDFRFNGAYLSVDSRSTVEEVLDEYYFQLKLMRD